MEETLDAALSKIFGDLRSQKRSSPSKTVLLPAAKGKQALLQQPTGISMLP